MPVFVFVKFPISFSVVASINQSKSMVFSISNNDWFEFQALLNLRLPAFKSSH